MAHSMDERPAGPDVPGWTARPWPPRSPLIGRTVTIEPLDAARHAADLYDAYAEDLEGHVWTYLFDGPFDNMATFRAWLDGAEASRDPMFHTVISRETGRAIGVQSYLRIDQGNGVIELGYITFAPALQRTVMATEAMSLMMRRAFDELGYRRFEWKCDALNAPSRRAAARLGLTYEGTFRQAVVVKGRNRDTAWFAAVDKDWPAIRAAHETWLAPENFDADGRQRQSLSVLTAPLLQDGQRRG